MIRAFRGNMDKKISVVLPVYNVKQYLDRCMESVLKQTYTNIEIILVDDGSTDGSSEVCDAYAKKDDRIVVIHKKNGGLSSARNAGTERATGEYITYIDSDDFVTETYVEYLYSLIEKYQTRMALCTHTVLNEGGNEIVYGDGGQEVLSAEICLERMLYHDVIDTSAWAKMIAIDIARTYPFPVGKLFEDIGNIYHYFMESEKIACGYQPQYFYIMRKNSIVTGKFNEKKLDLLEMTDKMGTDVLKKFPALAQAVNRRKVYARFSTLNQMQDITTHKAEKKEIISYIRKNAFSILSDKKAPKRDKLAMMVLMVNYQLYRWCWKIYK